MNNQHLIASVSEEAARTVQGADTGRSSVLLLELHGHVAIYARLPRDRGYEGLPAGRAHRRAIKRFVAPLYPFAGPSIHISKRAFTVIPVQAAFQLMRCLHFLFLTQASSRASDLLISVASIRSP